MTNTLIDYFKIQKELEQKYGERTILIMQIGSFYESYEYDPNSCSHPDDKKDKFGRIWNEPMGRAVDLTDILGIALTLRSNERPYSIKNPYMAGFPCVAYDKYRDTILNANYVLVKYDQRPVPGKKKKFERYLVEVCSPTMQLDNISNLMTSSNIACVYIEYLKSANKMDNFLISSGVAVLDVVTGTNIVCEFYSKNEDQIYPLQEMFRFLISHQPRELVIHINDLPEGLEEKYKKYLNQILELKRFGRLDIHINKIPVEYRKIQYQIEVLNKLFNKNVQIPGINIIQSKNNQIIEQLGLDRMNYGRMAYISLLQYCHNHNAEIIYKLPKPDLHWLDENKHLILTHNAIVQLDLLPSGTRLIKKKEIDSLFSVLDYNQTHLGRRALYNLLQNPMVNPDEINSYYNMVDEMLKGELIHIMDNKLRELPDIERLQRKLEIKSINPRELSLLYRGYIKIIDIYVSCPKILQDVFPQEDIHNFNQFISRFTQFINFTNLNLCHIETFENGNKYFEFSDYPLIRGVYPQLDPHITNLQNAEQQLKHIIDYLNVFLEGTQGKKLEYKVGKKKQGAKKQDPTGIILTVSTAKAKKLISAPIDVNVCGKLESISYTSSDNIITSDKIQSLCKIIDESKTFLRINLMNTWNLIIDEMNKYTFFKAVANFIAMVDLTHSYAKVSYLNNYHRPVIDDEGDYSRFSIKELRHPIIEKIIDGPFITNDVKLGKNGMLVYGLNMVGKTSFVSAVALIIVMAQAGCFVPAHLVYKPYKKIITRLSGNDDKFKGQSSFAVEMSELRTILRQSDKNTLVISDELCRGVENRGGTSLVVSTIMKLISSGCTFLSATHLHELLKCSKIKNLSDDKLKICHLSTTYDEQNKLLIFDRKLQDGPGLATYGIMVAKFLELPDDFIDIANEVLLEITGKHNDLISTKKSRYNSQIYMDSCVMCGTTENLHTHHLLEQHMADEKGMIGNIHKNIKDNLTVLCVKCHTQLHQSNSDLKRIDTNMGKLMILTSSN